MIIGRILGWFLIAVGLAWAGIGLWLWLSGQDLTAAAGQLWFQLDPSSLNRTQSVVQRYVHPGFWDSFFLPLLQRPGYETLGVTALTPLVTGALLVRLSGSRGGRKRLFR
jgi:hypothetical protein